MLLTVQVGNNAIFKRQKMDLHTDTLLHLPAQKRKTFQGCKQQQQVHVLISFAVQARHDAGVMGRTGISQAEKLPAFWQAQPLCISLQDLHGCNFICTQLGHGTSPEHMLMMMLTTILYALSWVIGPQQSACWWCRWWHSRNHDEELFANNCMCIQVYSIWLSILDIAGGQLNLEKGRQIFLKQYSQMKRKHVR